MGRAIHGDAGWELNEAGRTRVKEILSLSKAPSPALKTASTLRATLAKISDPQTRSFVEEAVQCLEGKLLRASVVLSWVGAVSVVQQHVIDKHLGPFNAEAARRDPKWKPAKTRDDLSRMKEGDFLDVLDHLSIIGKNVKQALAGSLTLRNSCGHPNSFSAGEHEVAAHVERLILNVFTKF